MDEDDIPEENLPWTDGDQKWEDSVNDFDEFTLLTSFE